MGLKEAGSMRQIAIMRISSTESGQVGVTRALSRSPIDSIRVSSVDTSEDSIQKVISLSSQKIRDPAVILS